MGFIPPEPKRDNTLDGLVPYVRERVEKVILRMKMRGLDPIPFEGKRSYARQLWLYAFGRKFAIGKPKKTWTLKSKHLAGKAADIVSKSRLWNHPKFYDALAEEAKKEGLAVLDIERCHVEWQG